MKILVASVASATGLSKKNNSPYEINRVNCLFDFTDVETPNYQLRGDGLQLVDVQISNGFYQSFATEFTSKFKGEPLWFDFSTAMDSSGRLTITGYSATVSNLQKAG